MGASIDWNPARNRPMWCALLALSAGCASQPPRLPAHEPVLLPVRTVVTTAVTTVTGAPASSAPVYFSADQLDSTALIEPPPPEGSDVAHADLQAVLDAQHAAHAAGTTARAVADSAIDCQRVADVLVPALPAQGDGADAVAFATRAAKQVSGAAGAPKRYWARPRPFVVSTAVERLADVAPGSPFSIAGGYERDHTSYPSGHMTFGTACAIVLSQMVPEQRADLFARARLYGESRLIVGAHFPTDVDAGRRVGTAAAGVMLRNAQFQADLRAARAQLRGALGLPQIAP
jgi:acid phosphatase (class A)